MASSTEWELRALDSCAPNSRSQDLTQKQQCISLETLPLTIGRDNSCDLVLDGHSYPMVSQRHARIDRQKQGAILTDLNSKNGTWVGEELLKGAVEIREGDRLRFGGERGPVFEVTASGGVESSKNFSEGTCGGTGEPELASAAETSSYASTEIVGEPLGVSSLSSVAPEPEELPSWAARRHGSSMGLILGLNCGFVLLLAAVGFYVNSRVDELEQELAVRSQAGQPQDGGEVNPVQSGGSLPEHWQQQQRQFRQRISRLEAELKQIKKNYLTQDSLSVKTGAAVLVARTQQLLASTVMIEKRVRFRRSMQEYLQRDGKGGYQLAPHVVGDPSFDFQVESGSGFCVDSTGLILTSAHVVVPMQRSPAPNFGDLKTVTLLKVTFHGEGVGRSAEYLTCGESDSAAKDVAILRVMPFSKMPIANEWSTRNMMAGDAIQLFGYPFGEQLIHARDQYSASQFRGSISRILPGLLQVQASVYPGCSGSPVVDGEGLLIGIVVSVQQLGSGAIASDIGYVVPLRGLRDVWSGR